MPSPKYKLTYFKFFGLAEPSRFLFHLADVPFEDVRIEVDEWKDKKEETAWGCLPELDINGKKICQSKAIHYYLAKKFGFAGKDEFENGKVLEYLCTMDDIFGKLKYAFFEEDPEKKDKMFKKIVHEDISAYYKNLEKALDENGTGYFVGNQFTVADLNIFVWLMGVEESWAPGLLAKHPKLKSFADRIKNMPKIKEWIEKRTVYPFAFISHKVQIE